MTPSCSEHGDSGMDSRKPHGRRLHRSPHTCTGPTDTNAPHVCEVIKRAYDRVRKPDVVLPFTLGRATLQRAESIHSRHQPVSAAQNRSRQGCKWVRQNTTGNASEQ